MSKELYPHIITEEQIDNTIIPYTTEVSLHNANMNETLLFDIKEKFGDDVYDDLITNGKEEESGSTWSGFSEYTTTLLEAGLQLAIGYYVVARAFRKPSTISRYGITNKLNIDGSSEPTSNSSSVSQANYYKSMADKIVGKLLVDFKPADDNYNQGFRLKIVGD